MTVEKAVPVIAAHFGEVNEDRILDMSLVFFREVIEALGKKLNFEAISNYAGNAFAKDSMEMINDANPLFDGGKSMKEKAMAKQLGGLLSGVNIKTISRAEVEAQMKESQK